MELHTLARDRSSTILRARGNRFRGGLLSWLQRLVLRYAISLRGVHRDLPVSNSGSLSRRREERLSPATAPAQFDDSVTCGRRDSLGNLAEAYR